MTLSEALDPSYCPKLVTVLPVSEAVTSEQRQMFEMKCTFGCH